MPGIAANKPLLRLTERGWMRVAMVEPASYTTHYTQTHTHTEKQKTHKQQANKKTQEMTGFEPSTGDTHMQGNSLWQLQVVADNLCTPRDSSCEPSFFFFLHWVKEVLSNWGNLATD